MKRAQLLGVAIAGVCGLGAFYGVLSLVNKPAKVVREEVTTDITQVLVAKTEIGLGQIVGLESFRWQDWPQKAVSPSYIQRSTRPNAIKDVENSVARAPMLPGEPVTARSSSRPATAACSRPSCRAACARSRRASRRRRRRGRLILPNDRVDVILDAAPARRVGGARVRQRHALSQRSCPGDRPADRDQGERQEDSRRRRQHGDAGAHSSPGRDARAGQLDG